MEPHTLVLLHEQNLLRQGLARLLGDVPTYQLKAQAADVPALKRVLAINAAPRLLLLSAETATAEHCGLLLWLHDTCPDTGLLLLGNRTPVADLFAALCAGAQGYLCTNHAQDRMLTVLEQLLAGAYHFPAEVFALLRHVRPALEPEPVAVEVARPQCPNHIEFLRWLLVPGDLTYAQIAERMGKHPRIIKKYSDKLRQRYGLHSRNDLVRLAKQLGLEHMGPPVAAGK